MRIDITYKRENQQFDQQYADEYNFGKESDGNRRYDMDDTWAVDDVVSFEIIKDANFVLAGFSDGKEFNHTIPHIVALACVKKDGRRVEFSVSKSLIHKIQKTPNPKYDITRIYFYLKPIYDIARWDIHIFDVKDIPQELLKKNFS